MGAPVLEGESMNPSVSMRKGVTGVVGMTSPTSTKVVGFPRILSLGRSLTGMINQFEDNPSHSGN